VGYGRILKQRQIRKGGGVANGLAGAAGREIISLWSLPTKSDLFEGLIPLSVPALWTCIITRILLSSRPKPKARRTCACIQKARQPPEPEYDRYVQPGPV
jgi:hypothetical protein